MIKRAIYPGTFDPITNGHFDIIKRALRIFDEIVVAVANSADKNPLFTLEQRVELAKEAVNGFENVKVEPFFSLLVDFAKEKEAFVVIRGLRAVSDFEYELQMGYANASLMAEIETIHLMPSLNNAFISSSVVRSIIRHNGQVGHLVPDKVYKMIKDSYCM